MVVLDRWSSYTVTIVWELTWADSALVILDEWLSYRGGHISRFDPYNVKGCVLLQLLFWLIPFLDFDN